MSVAQVGAPKWASMIFHCLPFLFLLYFAVNLIHSVDELKVFDNDQNTNFVNWSYQIDRYKLMKNIS